jgi:type II secretory pathway pseudopilin PulG
MLTELLVASATMILILGTVVTVFARFSSQQRRSEQQNEAEGTARQVLDRIVVDIRSATSAGGGSSQPVQSHSNYEIVYLVPRPSATLTNNARGLIRVRYCLDATVASNERLWMETTPYTSAQPNPPSATSCPSSAYSTQQVVARNLVNQLQTPSAPLFISRTDAAGNVTDVATQAFVDTNPTGGAPATDLRSSVTLRNLNRAPTAGLTCQAAANGHVLCDASASSDPEGQTLEFSWTMDGTRLVSRTYNLDQSGVASGTTHTFAVTATDPSGLAATAQRTVTMP